MFDVEYIVPLVELLILFHQMMLIGPKFAFNSFIIHLDNQFILNKKQTCLGTSRLLCVFIYAPIGVRGLLIVVMLCAIGALLNEATLVFSGATHFSH